MFPRRKICQSVRGLGAKRGRSSTRLSEPAVEPKESGKVLFEPLDFFHPHQRKLGKHNCLTVFLPFWSRLHPSEHISCFDLVGCVVPI